MLSEGTQALFQLPGGRPSIPAVPSLVVPGRRRQEVGRNNSLFEAFLGIDALGCRKEEKSVLGSSAKLEVFRMWLTALELQPREQGEQHSRTHPQTRCRLRKPCRGLASLSASAPLAELSCPHICQDKQLRAFKGALWAEPCRLGRVPGPT